MTNSSPKFFLSTLVLALVVLLFGFPSGAKQNAKQAQVGQTPPLEVRVTKPVQWVNGCLNVSIDRVNRSDATLYLPVSGIYMDASVMYPANGSQEGNEQYWLNLYGVIDIVSFEAKPLPPGATQHDEICYIRLTVVVVNMKEKTSRKIPVRGKLRIDAYYFLTKEDWLRNKTEHEKDHSPPWWGKTGSLEPQAAKAEATIPCYDAGCRLGCDSPPVVLDGETVFLFNPSEPEWEARGSTINEELAHKSPSCAEALEPK